MIARRHRIFLWAAPLIALSWLTLAPVDLRAPRDSFTPSWGEIWVVGYFFGSLFAHATLAAAWAAFGLGPLIQRLPLSLVWVGSLLLAIAINGRIYGDTLLFVVGGCLLGQWLLLQLPLWGLALGFALRLRHIDEVEQAASRHLQFGIRQLLIVTAIVAVVLAIGRVLLPHLPNSGGVTPTFVFLTVAAIVLTLPLLVAALMRRRALPGVLLSLGLMAVVTALELPLLKALQLGGPEQADFIAINVFSAAVILLFALAARLNGYRLDARHGLTGQKAER